MEAHILQTEQVEKNVGKELSIAGTQPIFRFWETAYAAYRRPISNGLGFHVPQFPGALLSPNFVLGPRGRFLESNRGLLSHFNEILPLGFDQRGPAPVGYRLKKQFFLGQRKLYPQSHFAGYSVEVLPLREAIKSEEFWVLITDGFGGDAPFLRALMPFLTTLEADFRTVFLREGRRRLGLINVGVAGGAAFVFNTVIASAQRGRGLSTILADVAQDLAYQEGAADSFFWTEQAFFGKHADLVHHYRIFERV